MVLARVRAIAVETRGGIWRHAAVKGRHKVGGWGHFRERGTARTCPARWLAARRARTEAEGGIRVDQKGGVSRGTFGIPGFLCGKFHADVVLRPN